MLVSADLGRHEILAAAIEFGHLDGLECLSIKLREIEGTLLRWRDPDADVGLWIAEEVV